MSSRTPTITALTNDFDAIERAIRETSRGRWFLNCYLERNRSAETRILLEAIARLEGAMRESGHVIEDFNAAEIVAMVSEAIGEARGDIARLSASDGISVSIPVPRFCFGSIPRSVAAATQAIREAAASIENAASALRNAGVFHAVSRQVTQKAQEIARACTVQERSVQQMQRMAALISEIEAETMAAMDGQDGEFGGRHTTASSSLQEHNVPLLGRSIPDGVMEELSLALADGDLPNEDIIAPA